MVVKLKDFSLSLWASVLIVCRCVVSTVVWDAMSVGFSSAQTARHKEGLSILNLHEPQPPFFYIGSPSHHASQYLASTPYTSSSQANAYRVWFESGPAEHWAGHLILAVAGNRTTATEAL